MKRATGMTPAARRGHVSQFPVFGWPPVVGIGLPIGICWIDGPVSGTGWPVNTGPGPTGAPTGAEKHDAQSGPPIGTPPTGWAHGPQQRKIGRHRNGRWQQ